MESTVINISDRKLAAALAEQEAIIERADADGFLAKGRALTVIRDSKLYRAQYETFEAYCKARWEMSRPRVYQLIGAAKFVSTMVDIPPPIRERHIRPLMNRLDNDQDRLTVWRKVLAAAGGNPRNVKAAAVANETDRSGVAKPRASRSNGGGGGGGGKRGLNMPMLKKAIAAVQPYLDTGQRINTRALGKEAGVSHVTIEAAISALAIAREMLAEAPTIDPSTLSMTAQQKLNAATKQAQKKLDAEHATRMMHINEEVRQRVVAEGKEYRETMQAREKKARETESLYREFLNNSKAIFTESEFMAIWRCLHPDSRMSVTDKRLDTAFKLFDSKKLQLTKTKQ